MSASLIDEIMKCNPEVVDKRRTVGSLHTGDKVQLTNGDIVDFVEMKRTNFVAIMNDKRYRIPVDMYESTIQRTNQTKSNDEDDFDNIVENQEKKEKGFDYNNYKKGELGYINKKGKAILFIFQEIKKNKVIGINPIDGWKITIDNTFEFGRVLDVK